jgi:probable addiction module antidote protein
MANEEQYGLAASEFDPEKIKSFETVDVADYLNSPEDLADYLSEFFAEADSTMIAAGLRTAARAVGMTEIAQKSGLARESLYKALRQGSQPRLETIVRVLNALGMQLVVQPIQRQSTDDTHDVELGSVSSE